MTIHSWGAVSPNCQDLDSVIKCIRTCKPALQRWKKAKVLIIDEGTSPRVFAMSLVQFFVVSMVDGQLFEQLEAIATKLRKKTDKPFGGIQVHHGPSFDPTQFDEVLYRLWLLGTSISYLQSRRITRNPFSPSSRLRGSLHCNTQSNSLRFSDRRIPVCSPLPQVTIHESSSRFILPLRIR